MIASFLWWLLLWQARLALRYLLPPLLLSLVVLFHPPTCGWALSQLINLAVTSGNGRTGGGSSKRRSSRAGAGGTTKAKKTRVQVQHVSIRAVHLLRIRLEGLQASTRTLSAEDGAVLEEGAVVVECLELRTAVQAALYSFFKTRPLDLHISGVHAKTVKLQRLAAPPTQPPHEGGGAGSGASPRGGAGPPPPAAAPASPFSKVTQDPRAWRALVWAGKLATFTLQDFHVESDDRVKGVVTAMDLQSLSISATHVVHPRQLLSLDVTLTQASMGLRGASGEGGGEGMPSFVLASLDGLTSGLTLEPHEERPASAFLSLHGDLRLTLDPAHLPQPPHAAAAPTPPVAVSSPLVEAPAAARSPSPHPPPSSSSDKPATPRSRSGRPPLPPPVTIPSSPRPPSPATATDPAAPPEVHLSAVPRRGYVSLRSLELHVVGPSPSSSVCVRCAWDATWVFSHVLAPSASARGRPRDRRPSHTAAAPAANDGGERRKLPLTCVVPRMAGRYLRVDLGGSSTGSSKPVRVVDVRAWKVEGVLEMEDRPVSPIHHALLSPRGSINGRSSGSLSPSSGPRFLGSPRLGHHLTVGGGPGPGVKCVLRSAEMRCEVEAVTLVIGPSWLRWVATMAALAAQHKASKQQQGPPSRDGSPSSSSTGARGAAPRRRGSSAARASGQQQPARPGWEQSVSLGVKELELRVEDVEGWEDEEGEGRRLMQAFYRVRMSGLSCMQRRGGDAPDAWAVRAANLAMGAWAVKVKAEGEKLVGEEEPEDVGVELGARALLVESEDQPGTADEAAAGGAAAVSKPHAAPPAPLLASFEDAGAWETHGVPGGAEESGVLLGGEPGGRRRGRRFLNLPAMSVKRERAEDEPHRDLMTVRAGECAVQLSAGLLLQAVMLGSVQKRTSASMNRFSAALKQPHSSSADGSGAGRPPSTPVGPSGGSRAAVVVGPPRCLSVKASLDGMTVTAALTQHEWMVVEARGCVLGMVESPRGSRAGVALPGLQVESSVQMKELAMTATSGQESGRFLRITGLLARQEKASKSAGPEAAGQKNSLLAERVDMCVPPRLALGVFMAAGLSQKAGLELAIRRWEENFERTREPGAPRPFVPIVMRARVKTLEVVLEDPGGAPTPVMSTEVAGFEADVEMTKPPEELRYLAQKLDSDQTVKTWGVVVGGDTCLAAQALTVRMGALAKAGPLMAATDLRARGVMVAAAPAPDLDKTTMGSVTLAPCPSVRGPEEEEEAGGRVLFRLESRKDGLPLKMYGDMAVECSTCSLTYTPGLAPAMEVMSAVITRAQPSSGLPPDPRPLAWWDKLRGMIHGNYVLAARELHVLLLTCHDPATARLRDAVGLHLTKVSIFIERSLHNFCSHTFLLDLPAHPPDHAHHHHDLHTDDEDEEEQGGEGQAPDRHRLIYLPHVALSVSYAWDCDEPFGHHMQPDLSTSTTTTTTTTPRDGDAAVALDKFASFRAKGLQVSMQLEVRTSLDGQGYAGQEDHHQHRKHRSDSDSSASPASCYTPGRSSHHHHQHHHHHASSLQGVPLSARPWAILRLDLLSWLKRLSPPPPAKAPPSKGDSNLGKLLTATSVHAAVQHPCIAIWPSGLKPPSSLLGGVEEGSGGGSWHGCKGVLFLLDDMAHETSQQQQQLAGVWRSVTSRHELSGVSLHLLDFHLCHRPSNWRGLSLRLDQPSASSGYHVATSYRHPCFADAARFALLLERLHAAIQPAEDFLASARAVEVTADVDDGGGQAAGQGGAGGGATGVGADGDTLRHRSSRIVALSRSFSSASSADEHLPDVPEDEQQQQQHDDQQQQQQQQQQHGHQHAHRPLSFRPSFTSFLLNHRMMGPPPHTVPASHAADLPRYELPSSADDRRRRRSSAGSAAAAMFLHHGRTSRGSLDQGGAPGSSASLARVGSSLGPHRLSSPMQGGGGGGAASAAPHQDTTWVLIVTELRLLWTLSTRQAVNQFSADVMKAMRAYYDSSSEGERKGQGSDDEDEEDEEAPPAQQQQQDEGPGGVGVSMGAGDDDDLGMSIDLDRRRSFDSALSLSAGPSSLNSPPLSPCVALESPGAEGAGMSDLARRFLLTRSSQQGNSSNTNGSMSGTPLLPPPLGGKRRSSHVTLEMGGGRAQTGSGGSRRSSKGSSRPRKREFKIPFTIVLLYPQLNFRSDNSCGSLIIAASEAYMEGRKHRSLFKKRHADPPTASQASFQDLPPIDPADAASPSTAGARADEDEEPPRLQRAGRGSSGGSRRGGSRRKALEVLEKKERWLRIDDMSAHVVPLDVEVSNEVQWLEVVPRPAEPGMSGGEGAEEGEEQEGLPTTPSTAGSSSSSAGRSPARRGSVAAPMVVLPYMFRPTAIIQEVLSHFTLTFASISFSPAVLPPQPPPGGGSSADGRLRKRTRVSSEEVVDRVMLDLPKLEFSLTSRQFNITLDVIRNVMLAPPVKLEDEEEDEDEDEQHQQQPQSAPRSTRSTSGQSEVQGAVVLPEGAGSAENLDMNNKADRETLKGLIENTLLKVVVKVVEYTVGGGLWKVVSEAGVDTHDKVFDLVEIGFTGFSGQHVYFQDGSTDSDVQVESFWVHNIKPGPDSASAFDDATTVLSPRLLHREPCQRCGQPFEQTAGPEACVFHALEDGSQGEFRLATEEEMEAAALSQLHQQQHYASPVRGRAGNRRQSGANSSSVASSSSSLLESSPPGSSPATGRWTCCGATIETAPGCVARPHVAKERMVSVRAKSYPPLLLGGLRVAAYQFLEVSIFPGANYKVLIQLTKDITELFHAYFLTTHDVHAPLPSTHGGSATTAGLAGGGALAGPDTSEKSRLLFGTEHLAHHHSKKSSLSGVLQSLKASAAGGGSKHQHRSSTATGGSRFSSPVKGSHANKAAVGSTGGAGGGSGGDPVVFIKYVRFGDLNVEVSISGFAIKLESYRASVPPFVRQGRVLTWRRLIRKFEKHAVWAITTSAASSMMGGGGSTTKTKGLGTTATLVAPLFGGDGQTALAHFNSNNSRDEEEEETAAKSNLLFGGGVAALKKK